MGWAWIRLFSLLGLAKVNRTAPIAHRIEGKQQLDMDSAMAILNNRFQIMAQYRKLVIVPLVRQELGRADATLRHQLRRAKRLLTREPSLLQQEQQAHIDVMLAQSQALKVIYEAPGAAADLEQDQRQRPRHARRDQAVGARGRGQRHPVPARFRRAPAHLFPATVRHPRLTSDRLLRRRCGAGTALGASLKIL